MMMSTVETKQKSPGKKGRKSKGERKKKMKPWKKSKERKSKLRDKVKSSQTAVSNLKSKALETPNSLRDDTFQTPENQHEPSENLHTEQMLRRK